MTETNPAPSEEPALTPGEKLKNKRWNERVKLIATFFQNLALGILGLSLLRAVLDPSAQHPAMSAVMIAIAVAMAHEAMALYILGLMKAES